MLLGLLKLLSLHVESCHIVTPLIVFRFQRNRMLKVLRRVVIVVEHLLSVAHVVKRRDICAIDFESFLEATQGLLEVFLLAIGVAQVLKTITLLWVHLQRIFLVLDCIIDVLLQLVTVCQIRLLITFIPNIISNIAIQNAETVNGSIINYLDVTQSHHSSQFGVFLCIGQLHRRSSPSGMRNVLGRPLIQYLCYHTPKPSIITQKHFQHCPLPIVYDPYVSMLGLTLNILNFFKFTFEQNIINQFINTL